MMYLIRITMPDQESYFYGGAPYGENLKLSKSQATLFDRKETALRTVLSLYRSKAYKNARLEGETIELQVMKTIVVKD